MINQRMHLESCASKKLLSSSKRTVQVGRASLPYIRDITDRIGKLLCKVQCKGNLQTYVEHLVHLRSLVAHLIQVEYIKYFTCVVRSIYWHYKAYINARIVGLATWPGREVSGCRTHFDMTT